MAEDDVLSQDEINDLLGSIEDGAGTDDTTGGVDDAVETEHGPMIKVLDLRRPDIFTRSGVERMNGYLERWGERSGEALRHRYGVISRFETVSIDLLTYEEYLRALPNPCVLSRIDGGVHEAFVLEAPRPMADRLARLALGYDSEGGIKRFEAIHRGVASRLLATVMAAAIAEDLFVAGTPQRCTDVSNPTLLRVTDTFDMVVVASYRVFFDDETEAGAINLCIPGYLVDRLVEHPRATTDGQTDEPSENDAVLSENEDPAYPGRLVFVITGMTIHTIERLVADGEHPLPSRDITGTLRFVAPKCEGDG